MTTWDDLSPIADICLVEATFLTSSSGHLGIRPRGSRPKALSDEARLKVARHFPPNVINTVQEQHFRDRQFARQSGRSVELAPSSLER